MLLTVAGTVAACSADRLTNLAAPGAVTLSIATSAASAASHSSSAASFDVAAGSTSLVVTSGNDTLQIDSVNVVFARVVLYQAAGTACGTDGHDDAADHDCAELKSGPVLLSLPLAAGAQTLFDVPAPVGTYSGVKLRTHKPNRADSGPNTQAFLAAHPEYENRSIRVVGKFRGASFVWQGDPEAQLEQSFAPPLSVTDVAGLNLTLKIDVASWFKAADGTLLDPRTTSYPQIANNIKQSFKAFEDKNHTGHDDHEPGGTP
ncbi:MAG TPA: hypothetical protein VGG84_03360 [Gemmatimonadaceae bacterium]